MIPLIKIGGVISCLLALSSAGCIKQGTVAGNAAPGATRAAAAAPAAPIAPAAPTPGYGAAKYGEVPGTPVIAEGVMKNLTLQGPPAKVVTSWVPVTGQPFTEALRVETKEVVQNPWDLQLLVNNTQPVKRGDVLFATFYFRTEKSREESGEGQTEFVFELSHPPWTKSVSFPVRASHDWRLVQIPFLAIMDYPPGEAKINLRIGYQPQTIDLAALTVESFGRSLALSALPTLKNSYRGMEPDAPWRKAAAERIDKIRKGDLSVRVMDRQGQHLIRAEVRFRQTRQAFGLGTCVDPQKLNGPEGARYQQTITELFNVATLENNLKWVALAGDWGPGFTMDLAKSGISWLRGQGIDVRGHVLLWPGWRNSPRFLKAHENDPAFLKKASEQRIREAMTAVKGTVVQWDVVNEPFDNHDILDILGDKVMIDWFKIARATDPVPKLFINDYAILSGGGGETPHRAHYEKTIKMLVDGKAPFDGIGMQGHFGGALTAPEDMLAILDRFAKFKKTIWVTEFDVDIKDEELAGQFTRDFYTTLFSHPAVGGVVMWGFWDGSHWKNNAPLYRRDWSLKPAGEAFRKLALETWRTDVSGKTDSQGKFGTLGFLGDYDIEVSFAGRKKAMKAKLVPGGTSITVVLD